MESIIRDYRMSEEEGAARACLFGTLLAEFGHVGGLRSPCPYELTLAKAQSG